MEDTYDVEISNFDVDLDTIKEAKEPFLEAIPYEQLQRSNVVITKSII